jgi:hypothetical protein
MKGIAKFLVAGLLLASCGGSVKYTDVQLTPEGKYLSKVRKHLTQLDAITDIELVASAQRSCQLLKDGFTYERVTRLADEDRAILAQSQIHQYETMFKYGVHEFCPQYDN